MIFSAGPVIKLGFIGKPHGFDGKLKLIMSTAKKINQKEPLFLMIQEKQVPFFLNSIEQTDPVVISLESIDTFDKAKGLSGIEVYVSGSEVSQIKDLQLIGYRMIDKQLGDLGVVIDYIDHGAQQLAVIKYQGNECLIPAVQAIFYNIDHDQRVINADLPEGLLELHIDSPTDDIDEKAND
jgi:16S rRNA processing protein RimM